MKNRISMIDAMLYRADIDYCAGRLMHFGFGLVYQAGFLFQQAVEKYLKVLMGVELKKKEFAESDIEKEWLYSRHITGQGWKYLKNHFSGPKEGEEVIKVLLKYLDNGNIAVTSRYPGGRGFGYHTNLPYAVDYFVFIVRQEILNEVDFPIDVATHFSEMSPCSGFIKSSKNLIRRCFFKDNYEFKMLLKRTRRRPRKTGGQGFAFDKAVKCKE